MKALPVVGYFTSAEQVQPVVNPPLACPCPVCGLAVTEDDVRTVSVRPIDGKASGFYRLHRTCAIALTEEKSTLLDEVALWILARRDEVSTGGSDGKS